MAKEIYFTELAPKARLAKLAGAVPVQPQKTVSAEKTPTPKPVALGGKGVIIYGASWCKKCKEAKAFFEAQGRAVAYYDVEEQPEREAEMVAKLKSVERGFTSLPVIDSEGVISVGFSAPTQPMKVEKPGVDLPPEEVSVPAGQSSGFDLRVGAASGVAGVVFGWFAAGLFVKGKRHEGK